MSSPDASRDTQPNAGTDSRAPTFREAFEVWLKIGVLSFGGPAGQIALMHRMLVEEKRWIDESRFLHALNYCMLLPGPEAQQLATYVGWMLHGIRGGLMAGLLFIIPGALVVLALSAMYALWSDVPLLSAAFLGVKAAVLIIVIEAVLRIARRVLRNGVMYALAVAAFIGIFAFGVPFPAIVLGAALVGLAGVMLGDSRFEVLTEPKGADSTGHASDKTSRRFGATLLILAIGMALWFAPVVLAAVQLGPDHVLTQEGFFFSKLAVVTFGGAYAVLAYMAQQAVEAYGWLTTGEMLDGLGLAESTPGPLILVTQFVGFLGALRNPAPFEPATAALLGSAMTLWVTFVPCFIWIFLGAPYVERMRYNRPANAALSCITAAVVGVIANLGVWFGVHVLFAEVGALEFGWLEVPWPVPTSLDLRATILAVLCGVALLRWHWPVGWTLAAAAGAAMALGAVL